MSGLRLSLAWPGATSAELLDVAPVADLWNIAGLWIGDPEGTAPNSADSYVTATAAALTARTNDLRLGLFLGLGREKQIVRIAEDVAVVDQAAGGRVELAFVPPAEDVEAWVQDVARLLRAWHAWPIPGTDEVVPVIPGPAQPFVPRFVVGDAAAADALGAGRMVSAGEPGSGALVPPRRILLVPTPFAGGGAEEWLSTGPYDRAGELRAQARLAEAGEVLFLTRGFTAADVRALGTVLVPTLRAADRDALHIATDSWAWLTEKSHLHAPPS
jgi:hypothetical protein